MPRGSTASRLSPLSTTLFDGFRETVRRRDAPLHDYGKRPR
jgi:hypothetical protein